MDSLLSVQTVAGSRLAASPVDRTEQAADSRKRVLAQRRDAADFGLALLLLVVALPVLLATALALLLLQGRPVFYGQERVGLNGGRFRVLKFRSMRTDAEADGQARWAADGDPRITPAGRVIRRTRLDELPQLLNVVAGDMALIGPRPERPDFVALLSRELPHYQRRHAVKPGITGLAQVRGSYAASVAESAAKLEWDLYYLQHRTLSLDLRILLETVRVVLSGAGAR